MNQAHVSGLAGTGFSSRPLRFVAAAAAITLTLGFVAGCDNGNSTPTATTTQGTSASNAAAATPGAQLAADKTPAAGPVAPAAQPTPPAGKVTPPPQNDPLSPDQIPPPIAFEPPSLEFGLLKPGEERTGTVQVRNISDQPLRIAGSRSSCKCTAVDLANITINPGESVPLTATMKPDIAPGPKKAAVRIAFEGYGQVAAVEIHAEVALAIRCEPAYLSATEVLNGTFTISSLDGKPFSILASDKEAPDYVDFNPATDEPQNSYELRWDLTKYNPLNCDEWPGWWVVETDHADIPVIDLRIRHECTIPKKPGPRRWFPTSQRALLGRLAPSEAKDFDVSLIWAPSAPNHDDHVIAATSRSKDFDVELVETDYTLEEPELHIRVTPRPELRGLLYGVVELHSLNGNVAEYVVIGRVEETGP